MYAFLDRSGHALDEPYRFLLTATRFWVTQARAGRCPCATLNQGFAAIEAPAAVRDFAMAMLTLDREGLAPLRFGCGACTVGEDEARVLSLFDAARTGTPERVRRIAATLVHADAAERLATAAEWVTAQLASGVFVERDQ